MTGNYTVEWSCELSNSGANSESDVQFNNTTDVSILNTQMQRYGAGNIWACCGAFVQVNFTGAAKTFKIQYRANTATAQIRAARIQIWKAS